MASRRRVSFHLAPPQEEDNDAEEEEGESGTDLGDDTYSSDADLEPEPAVNPPRRVELARNLDEEEEEEEEEEEGEEEEEEEEEGEEEQEVEGQEVEEEEEEEGDEEEEEEEDEGEEGKESDGRVKNAEEKGKGSLGVELGDNLVLPTCPVCMEKWTSEGPHRVCCIPCGHVYGRLCLEKWLNKCGNKGKCPQCNGKFNPKQIINLFAPRIVVPNDDLEKEVTLLREKIELLTLENARLLEETHKQMVPQHGMYALMPPPTSGSHADQMNYMMQQLCYLLTRLEAHQACINEELQGLKEELQRMDEKLQRMDENLQRMNETFQRTNDRIQRMNDRFQRMNDRFQRSDVRMTHNQHNELSGLFDEFQVPANNEDGNDGNDEENNEDGDGTNSNEEEHDD